MVVPAHAGLVPPTHDHVLDRLSSPHTRGWSQIRHVHDRLFHVVPAHAGLVRPGPSPWWTEPVVPAHAGLVPVPDSSGSAATAASRPRTRGAGPGVIAELRQALESSPHTRGWSRCIGCDYDGEPVVPAHAGLVPRRHRVPVRDGRRPRTRGAGPAGAGFGSVTVQSSPHTRGWSPQLLASLIHPVVVPAHAGLVRTAARSCGTRCGRPRTRGAGPPRPPADDPRRKSSPHTRGWSGRDHGRARGRVVVPAHAGLVPNLPCRVEDGAGRPRTRGAGPDARHDRVERSQSSPHTRGWSHLGVERGHGADVVPAHAGLVPGGSSTRKTPAGRPRTRGAGPTPAGKGRSNRPSSPAHAGLVPRRRRRPACGRRRPRTRGAGPIPAAFAGWVHGSSPHTRGWSLASDHVASGHAVVPAQRGAGPDWMATRKTKSTSSPRTRGWVAVPADEVGAFGVRPHTRDRSSVTTYSSRNKQSALRTREDGASTVGVVARPAYARMVQCADTRALYLSTSRNVGPEKRARHAAGRSFPSYSRPTPRHRRERNGRASDATIRTVDQSPVVIDRGAAWASVSSSGRAAERHLAA